MILSTLFIVLNTYFLSRELYWFMIFPVVLLVILAAFIALDVLVLVIIFCTPLSVLLQQFDFGVAISIPTEPLLFGVMIIYIMRLFYEITCMSYKYERKIVFSVYVPANLSGGQ